MTDAEATTVAVGDVTVRGIDVDAATRCAHYGSERDVVAFEFACCGRWYPCLACHDRLTDHERTVWPPEAFDRRAVLCGACGRRLRIDAYLDADHECPACGAAFNPGCEDHYPEYFDV